MAADLLRLAEFYGIASVSDGLQALLPNWVAVEGRTQGAQYDFKEIWLKRDP